MSPSPGKKRRRRSRDTQGQIPTPSVSAVRRTARRITHVSELYGGGETGRLLAADLTTDQRVAKLLQRRHAKVNGKIHTDGYYRTGKHEWKVPLGVRLCVRRPLIYGQIANQYPWYVTWVSKTDGKRKRKFFMTALGGIHFIATKAQYVDKHSALVSRSVGYDIPFKLVNKLPKPWRWCPQCMTARKFRRRGDGRTFYATRKEWNEEKGRFEWRERKLQILECPVCHCTNQNTHMRRSNQPWEIRHIKPRVRRIRRQRQRKPSA